MILIIRRAVLHKLESKIYGKVGKTYPYHSQEGTDSTESGLSR